MAVVDLKDRGFLALLKKRTTNITTTRLKGKYDLIFTAANKPADLKRLADLKEWIEPNGGIWVVRQKGPGSPLRDTDLIAAGLAAGLVDNKIASFSDTQSVMRFVFRLRDRPR